MGKEQISIYKIAEEAGVSPATVSRVLTGNARVSEKKKQKVEALIKKYGYKPNAMARALSTTRSGLIGLLTTDLRNPYYAEAALECEKCAYEHGYVLMQSSSLNNPEIEEYHLEKMSEQRVDALILLGGKVDDLVSDQKYVSRINQLAQSVPVIINGELEGGNCYQVNIDEGLGMERLMEYLVSRGHREICLLGGSREVRPTYEKWVRYRDSLVRFGLDYRPEYVRETGAYSVESGYAEMKKLLESRGTLPSAVVAINDFAAAGVIRAIREHGLQIPEDMAVASFDDTFLAKTSLPRLTSVGYDYGLMGRTLVETAILAAEGKDPERIRMIEPRLCVRESA